jgi:hypothetical protein
LDKRPNPKEIIDYVNWVAKNQEERVKAQRLMLKSYELAPGMEHTIAAMSGNEWIVEMRDPLPHDTTRQLASILANKEPHIKVTIPQEAIQESEFDKTSPFAIAAWRKMTQILPRLKNLINPNQQISKLQSQYENLLRYFFEQNDSHRDGWLRRDAARDALNLDQIVFKVVDLRITKGWDDYKDSDDGRSPFIIRRVNPITFYFERNEYDLTLAVERYRRPVREIKQTYGDNFKGDLESIKNDMGMVDFTEVWWCQDGCYWKMAFIEKVNEDNVRMNKEINSTVFVTDDDGNEVEENTLGFIPYVVKTCIGNQDHIEPFLYAAVQSGLLQASNVASSFRLGNALKTINAPWRAKGFVKGSTPPVLDFRTQGLLMLEPGQDIEPPLVPPINQTLDESLASVGQKLQESTLPMTVMGSMPGQSSRTPASAFALSISQGSQVLKPIKEALDGAFSEASRMLFRYMKAYQKYATDKKLANLEVWLNGGKTIIDPDSFPKWMKIEVNFEEDVPQDKMGKWNQAMQAFAIRGTDNVPLMPRRYAYEYAGVEDVNSLMALVEEERKAMQKQSQAGPPAPDMQKVGNMLIPTDIGNESSGGGSQAQQQGFPVNHSPQTAPQAGGAK